MRFVPAVTGALGGTVHAEREITADADISTH